MIKNIIFDIGMVLVDFRYRDYCRDLGMSEETIEKVAKAMPESDEWTNLDKGILTQAECISMFKSLHPEISKEIDLFWSNIEEIVHPFPQSAVWLSDLKSRGYNVYLLTNYPEEMFSLHCKTQFDFLGFVDGMVVSSHYKLVKPDARIYQTLLSKYNLSADECVFLDDRKANTESAEALGIRTITVDSHTKAILLLNSLLKKDKQPL